MNSVENINIKKQEASARILELRKKITDQTYLDNAIQRIALILSRKLVEKPKGQKEIVNGL